MDRSQMLKLVEPMLSDFKEEIARLRSVGATQADIEDMLDKFESAMQPTMMVKANSSSPSSGKLPTAQLTSSFDNNLVADAVLAGHVHPTFLLTGGDPHHSSSACNKDRTVNEWKLDRSHYPRFHDIDRCSSGVPRRFLNNREASFERHYLLICAQLQCRCRAA